MSDEPVEIPERVPLFPLPEVVLFPGALLPLHVFEPRYREMTADALLGDRCIAVALLKRGFEPLYETDRAPIHRVVGVGRIVEFARLEDGRYNLTLRGDARARIVAEHRDRPYRVARIDPLPTTCQGSQARIEELRTALQRSVLEVLCDSERARARWSDLFASGLRVGELADLVAAGLPLIGEVRQLLLAEVETAARASLLVEHIRLLVEMASQRARLAREGGCSRN